MEFPILYTLTGTNGVRYWKINVANEATGVFICREYGKYGGKPIINRKLISEAKSQLTVYNQALFEAMKDWMEMKDKKGYVDNLKVLSDTSSQLSMPTAKIEVTLKDGDQSSPSLPAPLLPPVESDGRIIVTLFETPPASSVSSFKFLPMLANKFTERKGYVVYPCLAQPKLDGIRYTAHKISSTSIILKTRNDALCPFFDEIKDALLQLNLDPNVLLDGEFYSKKIPFRTLNGYCNRRKLDGKTGYHTIPRDELTSIHYYLFDCYFINEPKKPFAERYIYLSQLMAANKSDYLKLVPTFTVAQESDIKPLHDRFVEDGYEGIMIRNAYGPYKLKDRSNDLLKYKDFQDMEFIIAGAKCPTNGKEEGCIIWILRQTTSETTFTCRPRDTYEARKTDWSEYTKNPQKFIGQKYTVRFQETYENGVPRFPVGISIRYDC